MEEALATAESKAASIEKLKNRMNEEVEDLLLGLEKVGTVSMISPWIQDVNWIYIRRSEDVCDVF